MTSKEDLARRLEFLGITGAEAGCLRPLGPLLAKASEGLVVDFCRHLLSFPETDHLFKHPDHRERLLEHQRDYLRGLATEPLDLEYVQGRRRMGELHEEAGLPPWLFLGVSAHSFSMLAYMIEDSVNGDLEQFRLLLVALVRRMLLDAGLGMECYVERRERRLEYLNEELAQTLRDVDRLDRRG